MAGRPTVAQGWTYCSGMLCFRQFKVRYQAHFYLLRLMGERLGRDNARQDTNVLAPA
jgi:hypothetical protein